MFYSENTTERCKTRNTPLCCSWVLPCVSCEVQWCSLAFTFEIVKPKVPNFWSHQSTNSLNSLKQCNKLTNWSCNRPSKLLRSVQACFTSILHIVNFVFRLKKQVLDVYQFFYVFYYCIYLSITFRALILKLSMGFYL